LITETIVLNKERNVTLTAYVLETGGEYRNIDKRPAILVLPGGGYTFCSDREADPVAFAYLKAGYSAFILRYSVKEHAVWPNPLDDYEQAIQLIRSKTDEWRILPDRVAIVGFSAGGHLAAAAATMAKNKPDAAILGYAVTMGSHVKMCSESAPDTVGAVDEKTSPCFVFATRTDSVVPIENSVNFLSALAQHGVSFESHIYSHGPHGFSTGDSSIQAPSTNIANRAKDWVSDSIEWLKDMFGDFSDDGLSEARCAKRVNGDADEFFSLACTFGYVMSKPEAQAVVGPLLEKIKERMGEGSLQSEAMADLLNRMPLRDILGFAGVPEETLAQADAALRAIPNR